MKRKILKSKSVLYITPYFYPAVGFGGPVTATLNLTRYMARKGHGVAVLTTDIKEGGKRLKIRKSTVFGFPIIYSKSIFPSWGWKTRFFLSVDQVLQGIGLVRKFDVIHFQDFFILQNYFISLFCRCFRKPYIITPHGSMSFSRKRGRGQIKKIFYLLFIKSMVKNSSGIIAVSLAERDLIKREFPEIKGKIIYIPNIIEKEERILRINIRKGNNLDQESKILLFLGRIDPLKGVKELAEGFILFSKNITKSNVHLFIAGPDAGLLKDLKRLIRGGRVKNVHFLGLVEGDEKHALLQQSDILCLTSHSESLPTVVLEASSYGVPSLVTRECNVESLVRSGGAKETDFQPANIARAIDEILNSEKKRQDMGKRARIWYEKNFAINIIGQRYSKFIESLI
jgi:glycosyltransferase involved in cell wall biosynthesis